MEEFKKELEELINKHCIENICDMPDFILSEMICDFIESTGKSIKKNLDWHGCDSICHPKKQLKNGCGKSCDVGGEYFPNAPDEICGDTYTRYDGQDKKEELFLCKECKVLDALDKEVALK